MKKAYPSYTVSELCEVLEVSASSYYYQSVEPSLDELKLMSEIKFIFCESDNTYGKRRIYEALCNRHYQIGLHKISRIMKQTNLVAIRPQKKHHYPNSGVEQIFAPNLLKRQFRPDTHNTHWVGDITYIKTWQGWSYLACVMDLGSKEIVGFALSQSPNAKLALAALSNAIKRQQPNTNQLMFHSDQGVQYSAGEFRNKLKALNITQSMSRRGNCWDNAVIERFFRNLKTERLNRLSFINNQAVAQQVESYIDFYNYKRLNSAIDYMTPHMKYQELKKAA